MEITYHDDGSVTVECGDEVVVIPPRRPRKAAAPRPTDPGATPPLPSVFVYLPGMVEMPPLYSMSSIPTVDELRQSGPDVVRALRQTRTIPGWRPDVHAIDLRLLPGQAFELNRLQLQLKSEFGSDPCRLWIAGDGSQ